MKGTLTGLAVAAAVLGLTTAAPAEAQGRAAQATGTRPVLGGLREGAASRANPYTALFTQTRPAPRPAAEPRRGETAQRTVVCGLTLIPGDPSVDPGIGVPRADRDGQFAIRALEPPICR